MRQSLKTAVAVAALVTAGHAAAQITFYEGEGFRGRAVSASAEVRNFQRVGFNDRASSIVVDQGRWEVCEHARFEGRCVVLRRGSYPSLREFGMDNAISSVRPVEGGGRRRAQGAWVEPEPVANADYQWRRRPQEVIQEAPVTSVRAVVGPPNQRCWVERQQVTQPAPNRGNVGGAVVGGILGGVLGHQVGGGTGKDLATAGGVVAGAVIGSNMAGGNSGSQVVDRDVQRCETVTNTQPSYWDVTYNWRGFEHRVQMATPPGRTIPVNANGEPRM